MNHLQSHRVIVVIIAKHCEFCSESASHVKFSTWIRLKEQLLEVKSRAQIESWRMNSRYTTLYIKHTGKQRKRGERGFNTLAEVEPLSNSIAYDLPSHSYLIRRHWTGFDDKLTRGSIFSYGASCFHEILIGEDTYSLDLLTNYSFLEHTESTISLTQIDYTKLSQWQPPVSRPSSPYPLLVGITAIRRWNFV